MPSWRWATRRAPQPSRRRHTARAQLRRPISLPSFPALLVVAVPAYPFRGAEWRYRVTFRALRPSMSPWLLALVLPSFPELQDPAEKDAHAAHSWTKARGKSRRSGRWRNRRADQGLLGADVRRRRIGGLARGAGPRRFLGAVVRALQAIDAHPREGPARV